jgi:hypothetical protein
MPFSNFRDGSTEVRKPLSDPAFDAVARRISAAVKIKSQNRETEIGQLKGQLAITAVRTNILLPRGITKNNSAISRVSDLGRVIATKQRLFGCAEIEGFYNCCRYAGGQSITLLPNQNPKSELEARNPKQTTAKWTKLEKSKTLMPNYPV